ncbi:TonB-dependent receptor [Chryseobacterium sp. G0162]|uniref:outer membrane beta-barrel family protein n=1 Tax=Chryseobacterium sp. G0162 TaxID=2487063 RepID=UPI000F4D67FE|nr:outer membrane beta-barrel family protein [Chryseobacterium sp. G0162]AZB10661.1 TonB-dependent receptor [Chryseobacterium sp. G0162]
MILSKFTTPLTVFTLLSSGVVFAQEFSVTGKITDSHKQSLQFVQIKLQKTDKTLVVNGLTDSDGNFSLKSEKGDYILITEYQGKKYFEKKISLQSNIDLGQLQIAEDQSIKIEAVNIKSSKKLIERKVDRLVYNVENSIASQGMTGLDALRNTPLIRLQNESISIVGKGNVVVMINDRLINLSQNELAGYLQSLRSDDISKIEVITTPPSKYEAQGNSGMINIILKKNPNLGWSGNASASYQKTSYYGFGSGLTLNYQSKKISSSLKLRQYNNSTRPKGTRSLIGSDNGIYTNEVRKDEVKILGFNYSLDYKINAKQNVGIIYDFNRQRSTMNADGASRYEQLGITDSTLSTVQKQVWKTPTHTLNAYYDLKLDTLGKKLSITANYLSNAPDKVNDFNTLNNFSAQETTIRNSSAMDYSIYSGQADLTLPYQWGNIETGVKYTSFDNKSNVEYYNLIGPDYIINPANSNRFHYKEHNYAAYVSYQKDFSEKWSAKAGLRYEYTQFNGTNPGVQGYVTEGKYGRLFPTAYVRYKPSDDHVFSLSYSKRIERPSFQTLNPFRWYTNPYMYFTGTPTLSPSYNDNVELTYTLKSKFSATLYTQYNKNGLSNIARLVDGIYTNVFENAYNENKVGLQLTYNDTFFNIWETSLSATGTYASTRPIIPEAEKIKLSSFSYTIYNTISLNKAKTWSLLVNFWHDLPYVYSNIKIKTQMNFSPGIKASFLDKRLNVSAVVSDVFRTLTSEGYSYNAGYRNEFYNYFDQRRLNLSVNYSFGNRKVKGAGKNIRFEEKSRAN